MRNCNTSESFKILCNIRFRHLLLLRRRRLLGTPWRPARLLVAHREGPCVVNPYTVNKSPDFHYIVPHESLLWLILTYLSATAKRDNPHSTNIWWWWDQNQTPNLTTSNTGLHFLVFLGIFLWLRCLAMVISFGYQLGIDFQRLGWRIHWPQKKNARRRISFEKRPWPETLFWPYRNKGRHPDH